MQHPNLSYRYRFAGMHLITAAGNAFSSAEIQRQLGHKRYQPIWEMVNKLHDVMGKCDEHYKLDGEIELDDAFFTTEIPIELRSKPLKRGRGSRKKNKVLVIAESKTVESPKPRMKPKKVGHLKMTVMDDLKADTITKNVKGQIEETADVVSDDSTSYTKLKGHVHSYKASVVAPKELAKVFP